MRASLPLLAIAALASVAGAAACNRVAPAAKVAIPGVQTATADPAAGPAMAAGLWRQRVDDGRSAHVTRYCLDAGASSALAAFNQQLSGNCPEHQMALSDDGAWHFRTACDAGAAGKLVTEGVMRGDFARHYTIDVERKAAGDVERRAAGQAGANAGFRLSVDVRRLGGCPKDMKPGDVILPDGARGRLGELPANA